MPISAWTNGMAPTCSIRTPAGCFAPTSSTIAATSRWAAPGITSTSRRSAARRCGRTDEQMGGTWNYLDITPLGRQEVWEDSPEGYPQTPTYKWWNWHDSYVADAEPDKKWVEVSDAGEAAFRNKDGSTTS